MSEKITNTVFRIIAVAIFLSGIAVCFTGIEEYTAFECIWRTVCGAIAGALFIILFVLAIVVLEDLFERITK